MILRLLNTSGVKKEIVKQFNDNLSDIIEMT